MHATFAGERLETCLLRQRAGRLSYSFRQDRTAGRDAKKAEAVPLAQEQARALKEQSNTPQGRRDSLLMCLLLDHGLRCGEVAALPPESLNLTIGLLTFYRQKVEKVQTHR